MEKLTIQKREYLEQNKERLSKRKKIRTRFLKIQKWNAGFTSYVCFFLAITQQTYSPAVIRHWFNKLVSKDAYASNERRGILRYLIQCNKEI